MDQVVARLREQPGVEAVGVTTFLPLAGWGASQPFLVEGRTQAASDDLPRAQPQWVNEDYFRAMRIPLRRGRGITAEDGEGGRRVVVINEAAARLYWSGRDPIGTRIDVAERGQPADWREVVGIVGDVRQRGLAEEAEPEIYHPYRQDPFALIGLAVRMRPGQALPPRAIEQAVWSFDRDQPVLMVMPLARLAGESITLRRVSTILLGSFAAIAVFLAGLGLYGVLAHAVARRTHEIGVRMAVGARAGDVLGMVVAQGVGLAALGAAIGLAAALGLTRLLSSLLYGVSPTDPISFGAVAAFLIVVAAGASFFPARRAARVDPVIALRYE
jgi:putative ABC transport system permease protein